MLKHYLTGIIITVLLLTATFIPAGAESELDTGISPTEAPEVIVLYPELKINDNNVDVLNLQSRLRDLGYYNYKVTGYFGSLTEYAVSLFQKYNGIKESGMVDGDTNLKLYSNDAVRMPMSGIDSSADRFGVTPSPTPTAKPTAKPTSKPTNNTVAVNSNGTVKTGSYMDWSKVKGIFAKGDKAVVYDFNTGISWTVKRTGGS